MSPRTALARQVDAGYEEQTFEKIATGGKSAPSESRPLDNDLVNFWKHWQVPETRNRGLHKMEADLRQIYIGCLERNWNGEDSEPVTENLLILATVLAQSIPADIEAAEIGALTDGGIGFQWADQTGNIATASLRPSGVISVSVLIQNNPLLNEIFPLGSFLPDPLIKLLRKYFLAKD